MLLDNLFTILLPHFTLFINTVNWGDLCIEDSDIFNVVDYDMLGIVPIITFSWIVGMVVIFIILLSCQIHYNSPVIFIYGCFLCLLALYLITVDLISFYCSPKLVLILFECKFAVMAILLCSIYKVF